MVGASQAGGNTLVDSDAVLQIKNMAVASFCADFAYCLGLCQK